MKRFFGLLLCVALAGGCASTAKKIEALKPMPSDNSPVVYQSSTSFIDLPVVITLADIENQLNKNLNGLIYEDNKMDNDKVTMKVWKTAPIKFTEVNGKLQSVVPIKINANVKYVTGF